jgi:hypothetical protein
MMSLAGIEPGFKLAGVGRKPSIDASTRQGFHLFDGQREDDAEKAHGEKIRGNPEKISHSGHFCAAQQYSR